MSRSKKIRLGQKNSDLVIKRIRPVIFFLTRSFLCYKLLDSGQIFLSQVIKRNLTYHFFSDQVKKNKIRSYSLGIGHILLDKVLFL